MILREMLQENAAPFRRMGIDVAALHPIGSGAYGVVYSASGSKWILKITEDPAEYDSVRFLHRLRSRSRAARAMLVGLTQYRHPPFVVKSGFSEGFVLISELVTPHHAASEQNQIGPSERSAALSINMASGIGTSANSAIRSLALQGQSLPDSMKEYYRARYDDNHATFLRYLDQAIADSPRFKALAASLAFLANEFGWHIADLHRGNIGYALRAVGSRKVGDAVAYDIGVASPRVMGNTPRKSRVTRSRGIKDVAHE